jgi:hypothetical protein
VVGRRGTVVTGDIVGVQAGSKREGVRVSGTVEVDCTGEWDDRRRERFLAGALWFSSEMPEVEAEYCLSLSVFI